MRAGWLVIAAALGACAPRPAVSPAKPTAPVRAVSAKPPDGLERVPGCTDEDIATLRMEIGNIGGQVQMLGAKADTRPVLDALAAAWHKPCLTHFARFFDPPKKASPRALARLWEAGLGDALLESAGGMRAYNGKRTFLVPPEVPEALSDEALRELAPFTCTDDAPSCARAASYLLRAEEAFAIADERQRAREQTAAPVDPRRCEKTAAAPGQDATPFEAWAACAASDVPKTLRYADVPLRAPERGWLVIRGRRGHYSFADEIRAYDLATGAAYVTSSEGALVLGGTGTSGVDFASTDAQRRPRSFTGRVAIDQVRELAFVLTTRSALGEARAELGYVPVPDGIPFAVRPDDGSGFGLGITFRGMSGSSAQTQLAFTLVDAGRVVKEGTFMWPYSSDLAEDHAVHLLRVLEAGLVAGCAPAKLPKLAGGTGGVSRLDADPSRMVDVHRNLDRALETLRPRACPGAP